MTEGSCNVKIPKKLKSKGCVKRKYMGGHKKYFVNHRVGNKVHCGKLLSKDEYNFFKYIHRNPKFKEYFPEIYGVCDYGGREYMVIENLFSTLGDKFKFVDVKLGTKTAFRKDSSVVHSLRHVMLDKYLSTSGEYGFRVEGLNFKIKNKDVKTKNQRHHILPGELWDAFIPRNKKMRKKFIDKIGEALMMLHRNMLDTKFGLIGTSILIAHDDKKVIVKFIDFGHSYVGNTKFIKKIAANMYMGLLGLYYSI